MKLEKKRLNVERRISNGEFLTPKGCDARKMDNLNVYLICAGAAFLLFLFSRRIFYING